MKLLPIFLLLSSIFALPTCDDKIYKSLCGLYGYHIPFLKVDFEEVEETCKSVEHEKGDETSKEPCAALKKLDNKTKEDVKKKLEKLTWMQACFKFCEHRFCIFPIVERL
ncbi:unnamed protein product, partial [Cylicocyclus nassatus]